MKSHGVSRSGDVVAFLPDGTSSAGKETIRIRGSIKNSGVYQLCRSADFETVMKMTISEVQPGSREKTLSGYNIHTGDVIEVAQKEGKHIEIKKERMTVREKMILGISLDPNQMTVSDWEKLPGIGPVTAEKIVADRQKNGGFYSVKDLKRVPGIGDAKVKQLDHFFE
jgi:competence protein ComEA